MSRQDSQRRPGLVAISRICSLSSFSPTNSESSSVFISLQAASRLARHCSLRSRSCSINQHSISRQVFSLLPWFKYSSLICLRPYFLTRASSLQAFFSSSSEVSSWVFAQPSAFIVPLFSYPSFIWPFAVPLRPSPNALAYLPSTLLSSDIAFSPTVFAIFPGFLRLLFLASFAKCSNAPSLLVNQSSLASTGSVTSLDRFCEGTYIGTGGMMTPVDYFRAGGNCFFYTKPCQYLILLYWPGPEIGLISGSDRSVGGGTTCDVWLTAMVALGCMDELALLSAQITAVFYRWPLCSYCAALLKGF